MKKLRINYLFIGILTLLLAVALWPPIPWFDRADNRIAAIRARGELRVSTIHTPLTYNGISGRPFDLDYELAKQFADYLGVKLKMTVWQNISQLFDDLDNGNTSLLAAGLTYNSEWMKNYQPGPTYYSVLRQLVYKIGQCRPRTLDNLTMEQLTVTPDHVVVSNLRTLEDIKFPELSWEVDNGRDSVELVGDVIERKLDYTIADSVAINLFQRVHPELAIALDIADEQPVTWFSLLDGDNAPSAALLDFFNEMNEDGTLARIEEKYLRHDDDFGYVDIRTLLRAVDAVLPQLKPLFEKYAEEIDWRLLTVIAYQESHWDAQATSPTDVRGMMMLTKDTAQSLGITDRTDAKQSISGGVRHLQDMMSRVLENVPENEQIWLTLAAYNMGYAHVLDTHTLTTKAKGSSGSWTDVKQRLPLLSQKPHYSKLTYGYTCGHEAYAYVEDIRKYQISLVGYPQEKEKQTTEAAIQLAQDYPVVSPTESGKKKFPFLSFFSQSSSNYLTHSPSLLSSRKRNEGKQN